ncbi:lipid-A-disaccharide synthase [Rickettsiales bacterium LUAb2]
MTANIAPKKIYIIAGEPSGDFIGSKLINKLKQSDPNIEIKGIGGSLMTKEGLNSLFNIKTISIMGLFEVIPKLFKILKLIKLTIADIINFEPDILITIDSPGFNLKVAKTIKKLFGNKVILLHYVAPTVWAYKPKRAKKFAKIFNYLFCILPFEPEYFTKEGLSAFFVGHPIVESGADRGNKVMITNPNYILNKNNKNLLLLPGSREREIKTMLPIFIKAINIVKQQQNCDFNLIIPTIPVMLNLVTDICSKNNLTKVIITDNVKDKYNFFNASDAAVAASGTVSLELALAKTKTIIAYKLNLLTSLLIRLIIKIKFVSIINIMANREIIPEYLGYKCTSNNIANAIINILNNSDNTNNQNEINLLLNKLGYNQFIPSQKATDKILEILNKKD